jgi:hypothetical protein
MDAVTTSKTSAIIYQTSRRNAPEDILFLRVVRGSLAVPFYRSV